MLPGAAKTKSAVFDQGMQRARTSRAISKYGLSVQNRWTPHKRWKRPIGSAPAAAEKTDNSGRGLQSISLSV